MRRRWSNIPIPESYLAAMAAGLVMHRVRPARLFETARKGRMVGCPILTAGVILAAWAVSAADETDISRPERLVTTGPYAITRNPMYLAWALIEAGSAAVVNSAWLLGLLPAAVAFVQLFDIPREEQQLEREFGVDYVHYQSRVPRWL